MSLHYQVNNLIKFTGNTHYTSSTADAQGKSCTPGIARISNIAYELDAYPYHVIAENLGNSSVYGWVPASAITDISVDDAIDYLAYLQIINSPDYWKEFIKYDILKYLDNLLINSAKVIQKKQNNATDAFSGIEQLTTANIINTPEYWREAAAKYSNVAFLLQALGASVPVNHTTADKSDLRHKVIETAQSFLDYNEWDGSHQTIIDIYNNYGNLPIGYKVSYYDSWCATFVSVVAILCGIEDSLIPRECGCERQIQLFKQLGTWTEDDAYVPSPGDIIYYNWDDGWDYEYTDNQMFADHVGIVTACDGYYITVIEGNYHDQVQYRTIEVNGRFIRGFGTPNY